MRATGTNGRNLSVRKPRACRPAHCRRLGQKAARASIRTERSCGLHTRAVDVVATAERLAEEVLLPAALTTDRADSVPVEQLDALARAGLYGLSGPAAAGGLEADFQ